MVWKIIAVSLVGLVALIGGVLAWGAVRWDRSTEALRARLDAARVAHAVKTFDERELEGLPAPVQRFFRAALKPGQPIVAAVSIDHAGTFNMSATGEAWKPFTSAQRVITSRPGFVWDGRVSMFPGVRVHVHDAYAAGEGILHPTIAGVFTLMEMRGTPEVARGEMMRFLAEAAWYPTALLPSQGVVWEPVDDRSARVTMKDGALTLTMTFRFNDAGLIESARAESRGRTVGDQVIQTPWEGRWSDYALREGMMVPLQGEVAWLTPAGRMPYWRGRIERVSYEFAR
ncbi:MAG: DUF6920 family protein [Burkholderiales bacterium]